MGGRTAKRRSSKASGIEYLYGRHVIEEALRARRREFHRLLVRRGSHRPEFEALVALAAESGLKPTPVDQENINKFIDLSDTGAPGIVLEAGPIPFASGVGELCRSLGMAAGSRRILALDGVEDPQNVGSIVRVANAVGADGLVLTHRRSPPLSPALSRASAGAVEWQKTARIPNLIRGLQDLKDMGFWVLAADPEAETSLYEIPDKLLSGDLVIVLGAEGKGLRPGVRAAVDHRLRIPMLGDVGSLNVATAGAVVLYELLRRKGRSDPVESL